MAATAAETHVFLEVRRQLQSALLILGEPKGEGGMPVDISITPSLLQMKTPEGCTEVCLPVEVRLVPSSCRGLQYVAGDGIHLRLQAQAEFSTELSSMFNQISQAQEYCTFYCQSCGEVIIRDRKLLRVLPLPGENWGDLVGEWCCHPDPFANKPLHPRENDCFIGDTFFLVNSRSNLWQEPKANTKVICKRCKVVLGEAMSSETTKFYMTEIIIQPSGRSFPIIPRSQFVQSAIAWSLMELSSARSTFRFTIQDQDRKVYILLWLLNSDSLVIDGSRNSKNIKKFPLLEDSLKSDSSSAWNAIKVLYQPCIKNRNEKLASSWENDISVHSLTLPSTTCLELVLILSNSNAMLPPSLRQMNSFQLIRADRWWNVHGRSKAAPLLEETERVEPTDVGPAGTEDYCRLQLSKVSITCLAGPVQVLHGIHTHWFATLRNDLYAHLTWCKQQVPREQCLFQSGISAVQSSISAAPRQLTFAKIKRGWQVAERNWQVALPQGGIQNRGAEESADEQQKGVLKMPARKISEARIQSYHCPPNLMASYCLQDSVQTSQPAPQGSPAQESATDSKSNFVNGALKCSDEVIADKSAEMRMLQRKWDTSKKTDF
ncbi:E3 ubiquitin-protein ligase E3D [Ctenodactylus gundi]